MPLAYKNQRLEDAEERLDETPKHSKLQPYQEVSCSHVYLNSWLCFTHKALYIFSLIKVSVYYASFLFTITQAFMSMSVFLAMVLCVIMDEITK